MDKYYDFLFTHPEYRCSICYYTLGVEICPNCPLYFGFKRGTLSPYEVYGLDDG